MFLNAVCEMTEEEGEEKIIITAHCREEGREYGQVENDLEENRKKQISKKEGYGENYMNREKRKDCEL